MPKQVNPLKKIPSLENNQVSAIDDEQHFMNFWQTGKNLGGFEASEGFA